jgi:hypothetical protein
VNAVRRRLTYANVTATIALFLALGGSAYAVTLGKNTVKSRNIAKGAVKTADIANKAVSSKKLKPGAVPSNAIAANSIDAGRLGPVVTRNKIIDSTSPEISATVYCKSGEQLLGGGGSASAGNMIPRQSTPTQVDHDPVDGAAAQGWFVQFENPNGATSERVFAWAVCLQ